jgi:Family of unknown function (DUF5995)
VCSTADGETPSIGIDGALARFERTLPPLGDERRYFHGLYHRQTLAVKAGLEQLVFLDPVWLERWDAVFADLYFEALEAWDAGDRLSAPWRLAFEGARDPGIRPLVHVLVGMNAHVNYDLPRSLLAVMTDDEVLDPDIVAKRQRDFERIDGILLARVKEEDLELRKVSEPGDVTRLDRLLTPFNRRATKKFLKESRAKVWRNAILMARSRREGPDAHERRRAQLEERCAAKVADLLRPGQVILRLGVSGFGVLLPDA